MADSAFIAGWEDPRSGDWMNTQAGDPEPSPEQLANSQSIVVGVTDSDGETHYYTTSYITEDLPLDQLVTEWEQDYQTQFV